ncbi:MAG: histidinol-phosphatase [Lachnospiraceae bacterium]|nr:histidinol-phosphatase [Candidatus Colinaster scatohippi]
MKRNYHTHSKLCGHAFGDIEEYIIEAIKKEMTTLGISDHTPYPGNAFDERMPFECFKGYVETVCKLKEKYKDKIDILLGVEAEYYPAYAGYYESLKEIYKLDYLILGQHFFQTNKWNIVNCFVNVSDSEEYISYAKSCVEAMNTGLYIYMAHPDLIFRNNIIPDYNTSKAMDIIIDAAVKNDYILELNANGFRKGKRNLAEGERYEYPYDEFWKLASEAKIRTIIGSDCHRPEFVCDEYVKMAEEFAENKGIHLLEGLEIG